MSDGFDALIDHANQFFTQLSANNNKDWYEANKADYTDNIKKPALLLADILADDLRGLTGKSYAPKLFRIHRDVRFSKDKTPYNAHLHLMWNSGVEGAPVWFFGASPDYLTVGMGIMGLSGPGLTGYRAFVDQNGDRLAGVLQDLQSNNATGLSDWGPEPLKRVPKPFAPDHPQADLLRRKTLVVSAALPDDWRQSGVVASVKARMAGMMPLWRLLDGEFG